MATMLKIDMVEKATGRMQIEDYDSHVVKTVLDYMYAGFINTSAPVEYKHLIDVARFGQQYEVRGLVNAAFQLLHLNANVVNVFDIVKDVEAAKFTNTQLRCNLIRFVVL
jgi:hypothetical protein